MEYITFAISQHDAETLRIQPQCHSGGPWESDEGVTITFAFRLSLEREDSMAHTHQILQLQRVNWLVPVTAVAGDWALDLDTLKLEFPRLLGNIGWLRGRVVITPTYELEQLGAVPPHLADVIQRPLSFVTRIRFCVTLSELVSAKHPSLMGKIGPSVTHHRDPKWPPLEEMCPGPLKAVPVDPASFAAGDARLV